MHNYDVIDITALTDNVVGRIVRDVHRAAAVTL